MFVAIDQVFTLENILYLAKGALLSVAIAALSLLIGLVLGILGASGRRSKHKVPRAISFVYVTIIRGTPLLLQILIIFSVIPSIYTAFTGHVLRINPIVIGMIALSINSGAYQTELLRSGINGVDKGQWEACETLGLSNWKTMTAGGAPRAPPADPSAGPAHLLHALWLVCLRDGTQTAERRGDQPRHSGVRDPDGQDGDRSRTLQPEADEEELSHLCRRRRHGRADGHPPHHHPDRRKDQSGGQGARR